MLGWNVSRVIAAAALFFLYQAVAEATTGIAASRSIRPTRCSSTCRATTAARQRFLLTAATLSFRHTAPAGAQLYLRSLDSTSPQALPGTEGAMFPFWSPDSRSIAFFTDDKLKRIEVSGGTPVTICGSTLGRGGTWSQDGTIVAALSYNTGFSRVPASGGTPTPVTTADGSHLLFPSLAVVPA